MTSTREASIGKNAPAIRPGEAVVWMCFILSGFAALLYETVWLRYFSIAFGTSHVATATVLAAYMGGLAAGAATAAKLVHHIRRPVLYYAVIELLVGASALAVPYGIDAMQSVLSALLGSGTEFATEHHTAHAVSLFCGSFLLLALPSGLMGATLPVLAQHFAPDARRSAANIGGLYAANTVGAVAGTLTAAFLLMPMLGLFGTLCAGAAINGAIFLIAWAGSRKTFRNESRTEWPDSPKSAQKNAQRSFLRFSLFSIAAGSGALAFLYEIFYSRLLGHILGGSAEAFATMLASFLLGIAGGSFMASRLTRHHFAPLRGLAGCQVAAGVSAAGVYAALNRLPEIHGTIAGADGYSLAGMVVPAILVLLPSAFFMGATFPLILAALSTSEASSVSETAGWTYAWNTVGAIVGSVMAGFIIIPAMGYDGTIHLAVTGNLILGGFAFILTSRAVTPSLVAFCAVVIATPFVYKPDPPSELLRASFFSELKTDGRELFSAVGRASTVLVLERDGVIDFRSNGLPEASVLRRGDSPSNNSAPFWLTALPTLARPSAEAMLVIGFGGGSALEDIPGSVQTIDVVEIEPRVIDANRAIGKRRLTDPFTDARINTHIGDARGLLSLSEKRFDIIVSQPSHPWTSAASHLYTREFFELAKEHINSNGVFVQWIDSTITNELLFRALSSTVRSVFSYVRVYRPSGSMLLFVASDSKIEIERELSHGSNGGLLPAAWTAHGVHVPEDIASQLVFDERSLAALAAKVPLITDDRNLFATHSRHALAESDHGRWVNSLISRMDPIVDPTSHLWVEELSDIDPMVLVQSLARSGERVRASLLALNLARTNRWQSSIAKGLLALESREFGVAVNEFSSATADANENQSRLARFLRKLAMLQGAVANNGQLASVEHIEETGPFSEREASLLKAFAAALRGEWTTVRSADQQLEESTPRDLYFDDALRLRIAWRLSAAGDNAEQMKLAREVIRLTEKYGDRFRRPKALLVRVRAAILAEDLDTIASSLWQIVNGLEHTDTKVASRNQTAAAAARIAQQAVNLLEQSSGLPEFSSLDLQWVEIERRLSKLATIDANLHR